MKNEQGTARLAPKLSDAPDPCRVKYEKLGGDQLTGQLRQNEELPGQLIPQQDSSATSLLRSGTALSILRLMRSLTSYISFRRRAVRGSGAKPSVLQKPHASSWGRRRCI